VKPVKRALQVVCNRTRDQSFRDWDLKSAAAWLAQLDA
jgi:hypothetical protein